MIRPRLALAAAPLLALAWALPAAGQSTQSDRDRLAVLHRVAVLREVCDFPLSDAERTRLAAATQQLTTSTAMTEGEAAAARETVRKRILAERTSETCDKDGSVFQVYRVTLDGLAATPAVRG